MSTLIGKRILIVDDDPDNIGILTLLLKDECCEVVSASSGKEALKKVQNAFFSVIILDIRMPGMDGIEVLEKLKVESPQSLVILLTAYGSSENIQKACIADAYDLLDKPIDNNLLIYKIKKAFEHADSMLQSEESKKKILEKYPYQNIIGTNSKLRNVFKMIQKVAPTDACVLITGETGTGKELAARAIHEKSKRFGPFIAVNAGALPETLLEAELFGHEKGAFTDAKARRFGYFESCKGGTIFLDEIGDVSENLQKRLLRVLQEKKIIRLGSSKEVDVNARVITATNKNLEMLVKNRVFREDLYFRIKTITIGLPPLRERRDDIPLLIDHFIKKYSNKKIKVAKETLELLRSYNYPGNIRELEGIIEHVLIFMEGNKILPSDLPPEITGKNTFGEFSELMELQWKEARQLFEKYYIEDKLGKTDWNITQAAKLSGIDRSDFHKKISKFKLKK